jgi:hypothetical protein
MVRPPLAALLLAAAAVAVDGCSTTVVGRSATGLLTRGVLGVPPDPLAALEDPLDPFQIGKML